MWLEMLATFISGQTEEPEQRFMSRRAGPAIQDGSPSKQEIETVLFDDEIYDRISDDLCPPKEKFNLPNCVYVGGYVDNQIAGLSIYHPFKNGWKLHFQVLKPYREYARELLQATLIKGVVYVEIPALYQSVINFAKHAGFTDVSVSPLSHLKNGQRYDKHLLVREVS